MSLKEVIKNSYQTSPRSKYLIDSDSTAKSDRIVLLGSEIEKSFNVIVVKDVKVPFGRRSKIIDLAFWIDNYLCIVLFETVDSARSYFYDFVDMCEEISKNVEASGQLLKIFVLPSARVGSIAETFNDDVPFQVTTESEFCINVRKWLNL
jgi:hypothetical protein